MDSDGGADLAEVSAPTDPKMRKLRLKNKNAQKRFRDRQKVLPSAGTLAKHMGSAGNDRCSQGSESGIGQAACKDLRPQLSAVMQQLHAACSGGLSLSTNLSTVSCEGRTACGSAWPVSMRPCIWPHAQQLHMQGSGEGEPM